MDISSLTLEEIEQMQIGLELRRQALKAEEVDKKRRDIQEKIDSFLPNRDLILSLFDHSRTSCSDKNVSNGFMHSVGYARCSKCHLIEILNGHYDAGEFDISFDVTITKVE
jgi:hypothetical protein